MHHPLPTPARQRRLSGLALVPLAAAAIQVQAWAAPLACERAVVTLTAPCSPKAVFCPPGSGGPGMMQKTGSPGPSYATGSGLASGIMPMAPRSVQVDYTVPDVGVFAPTNAQFLFNPVSTRTWLIKGATVPNTIASDFTKPHGVMDRGVTHTVDTNDDGMQAGSGSWLLVGQVTGTAYIGGYMQNVLFGFSCAVPIENLVITKQR